MDTSFSQKNKAPFIAALSLLINLVFVLVYVFTPGQTPSAESTAAITLSAHMITAQGPFPEAWVEHTRTFQEFAFQIMVNTDTYGMIKENGMDYKFKDLIIKYPGWLEYYRNYRIKAWQGHEDQRLADGKPFPDYQPENSDLIAQAISLQNP